MIKKNVVGVASDGRMHGSMGAAHERHGPSGSWQTCDLSLFYYTFFFSKSRSDM
jgi:hypothetical protein